MPSEIAVSAVEGNLLVRYFVKENLLVCNLVAGNELVRYSVAGNPLIRYLVEGNLLVRYLVEGNLPFCYPVAKTVGSKLYIRAFCEMLSVKCASQFMGDQIILQIIG